jgi:hypothetical protein
MATLVEFLTKLNLLLEDANILLQGPFNAERLSTLQVTESLLDKDKKAWELMSKTVNMADRLVQILQPPAIQLAETYLGTSN